MSNRRRQMVFDGGKAPHYASKNRGLALLDEAIEQIELQAMSKNGEWNQESYRCGSGMCLAGWVGQLAGGVWVAPADGFDAGDVAAVPEDPQELTNHGGKTIHVHERAIRLLSPISEEDCDYLFEGDNELNDIRRLRDNIARRLADA